jgi:hypothetical protein
LILAAGPSLQKNIAWVRKNQNRFIIVAVTAVMGLLEKEKVKPDILMHVDGFEASMKHLEKVESMDFFEDSIAFFASFTYPDFAKAFKKENVYIYQAAAKIKTGQQQMTASNVGIMTHLLMIYLGCRQLYTLGLDLALDPETGATHTDGHLHAKRLDINKKLDLEDEMEYHKTVLKTEGNFVEEIPSTPAFINALTELKNMLVPIQKPDQQVFNLSNGARIYGTMPLKPEKCECDALETFDRSEIDTELKTCFETCSEQGLTAQEIQDVHKRIMHASNILDRLKAFEKRKFSSIEQYHYDLLGLLMEILAESEREEATDTNDVIAVYIQLVCSYVFDFINTKEIDNPKKHIRKVNKLLMQQFERLVKFYKDALEEFVEKYEEESLG